MELVSEKLVLKNYGEYIKLVAEAYDLAPDYEQSAVKHWDALKESNYLLFRRIKNKFNLIFVTEDIGKVGTLKISGTDYPIEYISGGQPYETQPEMVQDVKQNGTLKINIDYSEHPVFSVEDNVVMRTVHDYIVHILGNKSFGGKGEIAAYNLHVKLATREAVPALFTEVVGQACFAIAKGGFPDQKITILEGFDYYNLGVIDNENYEIKDKLLVRKDGSATTNNYGREDDINFKAVSGKFNESLKKIVTRVVNEVLNESDFYEIKDDYERYIKTLEHYEDKIDNKQYLSTEEMDNAYTILIELYKEKMKINDALHEKIADFLLKRDWLTPHNHRVLRVSN